MSASDAERCTAHRTDIWRQKTKFTIPILFRWHTVENFVVVCTSGNEAGAKEEEKERVQ